MNPITSERWADYLVQFSRAHAGQRATVSVRHAHGWRDVARPMALSTVAARPVEDGADGSVDIRVAGHTTGRPVVHTVQQPLCVRPVTVLDGHVGLLIEQFNGPPTLIHIWPATDA